MSEPTSRARRTVPASPFNQRLGIAAEDLADGSVRLTIETDASLNNELGIVHGGVASCLLDGAMGRAAGRSLEPGETCMTVQLSLQFLARAEGRLQATGRVVRRGRSIAFLEGECLGADGALVARAQGTWAIRPSRA